MINRAQEGIVTKVFNKRKKDWQSSLLEVTWAYNTTWKKTTGFTPFEVSYGKKVLFSVEFEYITLIMRSQHYLDITRDQEARLKQLNTLDELRVQALMHIEVVQLERKVWHDKNIRERTFPEGDWSILYGSRFKEFKGKIMTRWMVHYIVDKFHDNGYVQI